MKSIRLQFLFIALPLLVHTSSSQAQGRLVLNGGRINVSNGGVIVIANGAANAITRTSGYIISEGQNNLIKWNIGTTAANYTIPFGTPSGTYSPLTFSTSGAAGATGYFYFASYQTSSLNSTTLPTGVANLNSGVGLDASLTAVDRFWRVEPLTYTTPPTLSNLIFTYVDAEYTAPNKTAVENKLTARRWNPTLSSWHDYVTGGAVNTTANTVTITSLPGTQLFPWWSLQYPGAAYHWIATVSGNVSVASNWSATTGGVAGTTVPGEGDAVFYDDIHDGSCLINTTVDVGQVTVATGYSGTITQDVNSVNIDGDANFASGTFSGGSANFTVNGSMNITGAAFTSTSGTMDIKRNFTVSGTGTFSHNNGTLRFSGTSGTQTVNAPATIFRSIDVTNNSFSPGLILESSNQLTGVLTLGSNVVVDPDGTSNNRVLTLLSSGDSPTADAAVGILPAGASVNGLVTIQRHMAIEGANGGRIYRYIASPINAATVADIQGEIPVTGSFTGTSVCAGCNTAQSMFSYNEPTIVDTNGNGISNYDDGYIDFPATSNTETLTPGRGYALFVRGNTLSTARWNVRGNINTGNTAAISLPVSFTSSGTVANDGWNLVGNPFPSTIDWNAASGWVKTNINASIYIRDNSVAGGQYATWNGVTGTNNGSRYIAMGQAFWVKSSTAVPVLTANENVKAPGTQTNFFRQGEPDNLLRITLNQGIIRDETVIHFRADATNQFDEHADAMKLPNAGFNISTQLTGEGKMAINSLDQSACSTSLNLVADNIANGNYSFYFEGLESYAPSTTFELNDAFTGTSINLRQSDTYAFSITTNALSSSSTRFTVFINQSPAPMDYALVTPPVCTGLGATIQIDQSSSQNVYEIFVNDSLVSELEGMDGSMSLSVDPSFLFIGGNEVNIRATPIVGCGSVTEKNSTLTVEDIVTPTSVLNGTICREGSVRLSATGASLGQYYKWYATETNSNPLASGDSLFTTPAIDKSRTYFVSISNALGCEGDRVPVQAIVIHYEDPTIVSSNDSLSVEYTGKKQWYVDGELLPLDTTSVIKPLRSGIYTVIIPVQTCVATASITYTLPEITTGTKETNTSSIYIYPNPVSKYLYFQQENSTVNQVEVLNATGQAVGKLFLIRTGNLTTGKFDMSVLASGFYVVQLKSSSGKTEVKIIKE